MSRLSHLSATFALVVSAAALTASPAVARDHDRMPDKWEKRHHLNVKVDDSRRDRDRDGLTNYGEYRAKTNPRKKDSDRDGRRDSREDYDRDKLRNAAEIRTGFDPRDKDSDDDGVKDGRENAGRIVKLSDSSMTIKLAVGGSLTARLGDDLSVDCTTPLSQAQVQGQTPAEGTPQPGEDAPEPGEDEDPGDLPELPELPGTRTPATAPTRRSPGWRACERRGRRATRRSTTQAFSDDPAECSTSTLKVGATIHKAKVTRSASGATLVSVKLLKKN